MIRYPWAKPTQIFPLNMQICTHSYFIAAKWEVKDMAESRKRNKRVQSAPDDTMPNFSKNENKKKKNKTT